MAETQEERFPHLCAFIDNQVQSNSGLLSPEVLEELRVLLTQDEPEYNSTDLKFWMNKYSALEEHQTIAERTVEALKQENAELNLKLQQLGRSISENERAHKMIVKDMESKLESQVSDIETLRIKSANFERQNEALEKKLEQKKIDDEEKAEKLGTLEQELTRTRKTTMINETRGISELRNLQEQYEEKAKKVTELEKKLSHRDHEIRKMKEKGMTFVNLDKTNRKIIEDLKAHMQKMEKEHAEMKSELTNKLETVQKAAEAFVEKLSKDSEGIEFLSDFKEKTTLDKGVINVLIQRRGSVMPPEPIESSFREDDYGLPSFLDHNSVAADEHPFFIERQNQSDDDDDYRHIEARKLEESTGDDFINKLKREATTYNDLDEIQTDSFQPMLQNDNLEFEDADARFKAMFQDSTRATGTHESGEQTADAAASKKEEMKRMLEEKINMRKTISKAPATRNFTVETVFQGNDHLKVSERDIVPVVGNKSNDNSQGLEIAISESDFQKLLAYIETYLGSEKNPTTCVVNDYDHKRLIELFSKARSKNAKKLCRILTDFYLSYISFLEGSISNLTYSKTYLQTKNNNLLEENKYLANKILAKNNQDTEFLNRIQSEYIKLRENGRKKLKRHRDSFSRTPRFDLASEDSESRALKKSKQIVSSPKTEPPVEKKSEIEPPTKQEEANMFTSFMHSITFNKFK